MLFFCFLGHFLNPRHSGAWEDGFRCDRGDLSGRVRSSVKRAPTRYEVQERQANTFAIELLAPRRRLRPYLDADPDLRHALELAKGLDISREAAFRRFAELHDASVAIVFAHRDRFSYAIRGRSFPALALTRKAQMPWLPQLSSAQMYTDVEEAESTDWVQTPMSGPMYAQTLYQDEQRSTTLLICDDAEDDEGGGIEDAAARLGRFGR